MTSLEKLTIGQEAVIISFTNELISNRLFEMGCLPGEKITLTKVAPLGCPIAIHVSGYELSLRKEEARTIMVELVA